MLMVRCIESPVLVRAGARTDASLDLCIGVERSVAAMTEVSVAAASEDRDKLNSNCRH
jgi:hypothetical protein